MTNASGQSQWQRILTKNRWLYFHSTEAAVKEDTLFITGAHPTALRYNASDVKIYTATNTLHGVFLE
jgi:hypothetical protein